MRRPVFIARQSAHPRGILGTIIGHVMASETARDNAHAISLLAVQNGERVLDVGTGHGHSLSVIAKAAHDVVAIGVDSSDAMLAIAAQKNHMLMQSGQVRIEKASSDHMPFDDCSFDAVMTVHTIYFWHAAEHHLREIARVLRKGGRFVIGFKPAEDEAATSNFPASVYTFRTTAEIEALVAKAGFAIVGDSSRRGDAGASMVWLKAIRT